MKKSFLFSAVLLITAGTIHAQILGNRGTAPDVNTDGASSYYNPYTKSYESFTPKQLAVNVDAPLPTDNSLLLEAIVLINMKATSYTAIFSVTQDGKSVSAADSLMNLRLEQFIAGMKKLGIETKDVHVDYINMLPLYEVQQGEKSTGDKLVGREPAAGEFTAGFKLKKNVHIMFRDHRLLDEIVTLASKSDIYDLVKVDYNVNNIEAAYDSLRNAAVSVIAKKRDVYGRMGMETQIIAMGEGYDCRYPAERYETYTAYLEGLSRQQLQQEKPAVKIKDAEKEETVFYNKIPYKQFDRVINADIAEPAVQFYYKLRVRCSIVPKPLQPVNRVATNTTTPTHR